MNQIYDQPNDYDFGLDFDYSVWPIDTRVDLINVPWNNDYRDIVKFSSKTARDAWMDTKASSGIRLSQMSYVKPNEPVRIDTPFNRAIKYNYLRAQNPLQPVSNDEIKNFYYFILDVRYIGPFTTELILQLDVVQTYGYDVTFGNCYVERGHIGIANTKQMDHNGRDYLTVPEGLDTGGEYSNIHREVNRIYGATASDHSVIAVSTTDLDANAGDESNPKLVTANGSTIHGLTNGATYYAWENGDKFRAWLISMKEKPWVTQGIISIYIVPKLSDWAPINWSGGNGPQELSSFRTVPVRHSFKPNWRQSTDIFDYLPEQFRILNKFKVFPYLAIEYTMYTGTPIIIKPESWQNNDATVTTVLNIAMPSAKIVSFPDDYNATSPDTGERLNIATQMGSLPQTITVNDGSIAYLASNKNSIAYQQRSADWSQQKALAGAQAQYDIASGGIYSAIGQTNVGINADAAQTGIGNTLASQQALVSGLAGLLGGGVGGSAFGPTGSAIGMISSGASAIGNSINTGLGIAANNESFGVRNSQALQSLDIQNRQSTLIRDTNKGLADWSARGDYANQIAGINAKVQDAQLIQNTTSGQIAGENFLFAMNEYVNAVLTWKMPSLNVVYNIGMYWLRYGYAIQRFIKMPSSWRVMSKFTYWKLTETYITSSLMPEQFKQVLRGIFEKGVTVWTNPDDIGNIDIADNVPLGGISY